VSTNMRILASLLRLSERGAFTFACAVMLAGCASQRSYTILHLSTGTKIPVRRESSGRELVTGVDDATGTFRVLGANAEGRGFVVRSISCADGRVLKRAHIPRFSDYYQNYYAYGLGFAVSPSARFVAYVDMESKALVVFDTRSHARHVLRSDCASSITSPGVFLRWVSDDELLAGLEGSRTDEAVLALYSAGSGSLELELGARGLLRFACALSPLGTHFVYWEDTPDRHGTFRILDLAARRVVASISPRGTNALTACCPAWSRDGDSVAYLDGGSLMSFHLPTASYRILQESPARRLSGPVSYTARRVVCRISEHDGFPKKPFAVYLLDLASGQGSVIPDPEIGGEILAADSGDVLVYGMGQ
jgi:hypothetical protein